MWWRHTATMLTPDPAQSRVVNSTIIMSAARGAAEPISVERQEEFVRTTAIHRRGYDKPHLVDDL